jgi:N4-gp56 family major capsid protein
MADVFTSTSTNSSTALSTELIKVAYDKALEFKLRSVPMFRRFADKKPVALTNQGSTVTFNLYNPLTPTTTPIDEIVSPDLVQIPKTDTVSVTMYEYGRGVALTKKLRHDTFADVDPGVAQLLADDLVDSLDLVVRGVLNGGTNKVTSANLAPEGMGVGSAAATNTLTDANSDFFSSAIARFVPTKLREASVSPWEGELFAAVVHPDIAHDLRSESGDTGWRAPHVSGAQSEIWTGSTGVYEGSFYIETPRAYTATDGATSQKVYRSLFLGRQALAEAVAEEPHTTVSEKPVDYHNRNYVIGWYGYLGWGLFRQESVIRVETVSKLS